MAADPSTDFDTSAQGWYERMKPRSEQEQGLDLALKQQQLERGQREASNAEFDNMRGIDKKRLQRKRSAERANAEQRAIDPSRPALDQIRPQFTPPAPSPSSPSPSVPISTGTPPAPVAPPQTFAQKQAAMAIPSIVARPTSPQPTNGATSATENARILARGTTPAPQPATAIAAVQPTPPPAPSIADRAQSLSTMPGVTGPVRIRDTRDGSSATATGGTLGARPTGPIATSIARPLNQMTAGSAPSASRVPGQIATATPKPRPIVQPRMLRQTAVSSPRNSLLKS